MRSARASFTVVFAVGIAVASASTSAAAARPALSMSGFSPTSGAVGTSVKISGSGFRTNDIVRFNGIAARSSTANAGGTTLTAAVPAFAGSGPITVTDPGTGQVTQLPGTAFQVTRGLSAPARAWPGASIVVSGSALTPDARDGLRLGSRSVGTAVTNSAGDFQLGVTVPWDATPGNARLVVLDHGGDLARIISILVSWPQERHDEAGTGDDPVETTITAANAPSLSQHWAVDCCTSSGVAIADGMAFMGLKGEICGGFSGFAEIYADRLSNGAQAWQFKTSYYDEISATPAVANGVVYDTDFYGTLFALDATTGIEKWASNVGLSPGVPTIADGLVFVQSQGTLSALDASTAALVWSHQFSPTATGPTPAVVPGASNAGDEVIAGEADGNTYAYRASTGSLVWSKPGSGRPVGDGGAVYIASADGTLYARNAQTGALLWKRATGGAVYAPAVAGSRVFVTSAGGGIEALKASDGSVVWSQPIHPSTSPSVANGVVFFGRQDGKVQALNASNGVGLGNLTPANTNFNSQGPVISNGVVYFTTSFDGSCSRLNYNPTLYAYGL